MSKKLPFVLPNDVFFILEKRVFFVFLTHLLYKTREIGQVRPQFKCLNITVPGARPPGPFALSKIREIEQ